MTTQNLVEPLKVGTVVKYATPVTPAPGLRRSVDRSVRRAHASIAFLFRGSRDGCTSRFGRISLRC